MIGEDGLGHHTRNQVQSQDGLQEVVNRSTLPLFDVLPPRVNTV